MNSEYRLFLLRRQEFERRAESEREASLVRRWNAQRRARTTPHSDDKRGSLLARISVLF
jgi:hypothetical protein